jgi:uncharacterized repeat protein (TIGR01451 family)
MNTIINNRIKALVGLVLGITILFGLLAFATPAAAMTCNSATLTGTVITGTPPTHARFAYGTNYNTVANGGGTTTQVQYFYNEGTFPIQQYISGLSENTTYYFRLEVTNNYGTENLNINNFTTPSCGGGQPPVTSLSCVLDSGATPAPHYINKGVKFEAFGGNGSYSWHTNGGISDFESGSNNMRNWIRWSTSGAKNVSVSSGGQTANCGSVNIIDNTPAQTCQDPSATNYGGPLPCKYPAQTCQDPSAINYGGSLPCRYQQNNPTVNLTANPSSITRGGGSTLSWNSQYATSCSTSWGGGSATSGYSVVYPEYTTTYSITCQGASGTSPANDSVTVVVNGIPDQNPTVTLTADDQNIEEDTGTTLRWYSNNATSCTANAGVNGWSGDKSLSGSFYTGSLNYSVTYTITCRNNSGNTAFDSVTVDVNNDNDNGEGPEVTTRDATNIDIEDATLNGRVDGNGRTTRAWFEYGTSVSNLNRTTGSNSYGSGSTSYEARIYNLDEDTTYYFRAVAENSEGTDRGSILSFRTDEEDNNNDNDREPEVTTKNATNVSSYDATLNGRVDGNGRTTRAWFEYGTSTSLGYSTVRTSYGSGTTNYDRSISGLMPNTTYYFRAVAENSEGTDRGSILSFYTSSGYVPPVNNQPTVVIYADSTNLAYNGATTIRWSAVNATSCIASGGSVGWAGIKSIGPGSFYTGSLTSTRTYTISCSNNVGSSTDSVTVNVRGRVITNPVIPSSYVIINSSIDRNQPIVPTIDNTRPHPGDEINYTVTYQNIGNASITGLTLRLDLPYEVDYMFSNPSNPTRSGNTLIFNLGTLRANAQGTVTVRVRVRENIPAGTYLNFPAVLSYVDPAGNVQSVNANVSAQVWSEPIKEEVVQLGANVFGAGFFPTNVFGWLLLIILILLLVYLAKYIFGQPNQNQAFVTKKITTTTVEHQ